MCMSRVATLPTRGRRLLSTPRLHTASIDRVRKLAGVKSCALVAVVEGIHNRHGYDQYASTNSQLLAPHTADLVVASRKYADELPMLENGKAISPNSSTWVCEESGMKENLWLNLSTGHIGRAGGGSGTGPAAQMVR